MHARAVTDEDEQLQMARRRAHVLEAVVAALDQRDEASAAISSAEDPAAATEALAALLDTDEIGARAVLGLHWSAFTRARHHQAREDLDDVRRAVAACERP